VLHQELRHAFSQATAAAAAETQAAAASKPPSPSQSPSITPAAPAVTPAPAAPTQLPVIQQSRSQLPSQLQPQLQSQSQSQSPLLSSQSGNILTTPLLSGAAATALTAPAAAAAVPVARAFPGPSQNPQRPGIFSTHASSSGRSNAVVCYCLAVRLSLLDCLSVILICRPSMYTSAPYLLECLSVQLYVQAFFVHIKHTSLQPVAHHFTDRMLLIIWPGHRICAAVQHSTLDHHNTYTPSHGHMSAWLVAEPVAYVRSFWTLCNTVGGVWC